MRFFIAIALEPTILEHLGNIQKSLRSEFPNVKWVSENNFHLTIKFLGNPQRQERKLKKALEEVGQHIAPFDLALTAAGCFPERDPVRTVWVGINNMSNMIFRLQQECKRVFSPFANTQETEHQKEFIPHITLGRVSDKIVKGPLRQKISQLKIEPLSQHVTEIILYNSRLSKNGPQYNIIFKAPLTATIL